MSPQNDPWDPEQNRRHGHHSLTSIEITVTNRCNMRCRHCAVGETLVQEEPPHLPLDLLFRRLDEVADLRTLSVTGGEPSENLGTLRNYVLPILRYAHDRGVKTQLNSNLTYDLMRYDLVVPYVDVLHISWNYPGLEDFHRIAWGHGREHVSMEASAKLFERMIDNTRALAATGVFVSAESMVNRETAPYLGQLNRTIAGMGCRRHEVHPMYQADFAADLPLLSLDEFRTAIARFLDQRDPNLWVLFGTFPFLACSPDPRDRLLLDRVKAAPNASLRNCPDGRNRININAFTGEVFVTDFAPIPALGRIQDESLQVSFERWLRHPAFAPYDCYCPAAGCTGPNLLVATMYHEGVDFRQRQAKP